MGKAMDMGGDTPKEFVEYIRSLSEDDSLYYACGEAPCIGMVCNACPLRRGRKIKGVACVDTLRIKKYLLQQLIGIE
jgi:hypothetical protein